MPMLHEPLLLIAASALVSMFLSSLSGNELWR